MVLCGGLATVLLGGLSAAPAEQGQNRTDSPQQVTIQSLEKQLTAERARNQQLTDELARAKQELSVLRTQLQVGRQAQLKWATPVPPAPSVPEGWQSRQFNGMTYYVVPLHGEQAVPVPARH
jgi:hypothetical protein